ncbi:MAG: hypothetical protein JW726_13545 [Anaerolineales bacterium]|nr:hypothetical protein [Anaerolineales bacterium]
MTNHPLTAHMPRRVASQLAIDALPPGESQTWHAAVLYADLVGFIPLTELLAQSGPEGIKNLSQVLNTILGALVETVYAYGSNIAKFSGNALLAWWPLAEAAEAYQRNLSIWCKPKHMASALEARAGLARIAYMQGDFYQARDEAQKILAFLSQAGNTLPGIDEPYGSQQFG